MSAAAAAAAGDHAAAWARPRWRRRPARLHLEQSAQQASEQAAANDVGARAASRSERDPLRGQRPALEDRTGRGDTAPNSIYAFARSQTTKCDRPRSRSAAASAQLRNEWFWGREQRPPAHKQNGANCCKPLALVYSLLDVQARQSNFGWRQERQLQQTKTTQVINRLIGPLAGGVLLPLLLLLLLAPPLAHFGFGTTSRPFGVGGASAYQLTNNLIANNLPPKFVQSGATQTGSTGAQQTGGGANSEIVVRVKEGPQSIGKLICSLKGEDPDDDPLTFGVLGSMASDLLRIENVPGNQANVFLRKELDRETTESHQVVITLTDGKLGRGNWITKSMLIIVEDVNDNYPVFGPHRTAISVREDARPPLVIETVEASDADEGRFGQVMYKLDEASGEQAAASGGSRAQALSDLFQVETIEGKGVISLVGQLDYEQRSLYQLRVVAIDRAHENERLSTSTNILVSVEDCEDQPPMFTFAPSITRIPENLPVGSNIVRVGAVDGDRGVNSPIKYAIVAVNNQESGFERNLFSIGSDSGQIIVAHELDRELASQVHPSSGKPVATGATSQPGAYVLQVRATEVSSSNSLLESIFGGGGASSQAANSATTELTVLLVDVNDELPTFDQERYTGELLENSPAESLVAFVGTSAANGQPLAGAKVIDRDQGTNGTFTLHLEGEHGHLFEVWPSEATNEANLMIKVAPGALSGVVGSQNARFLDYERTKELKLTIVAREKYSGNGGGGGVSEGSRFSSAEMVIQLKDANDNYPQFDSELYRVEIPENAIRGMHICAVKALDADSGPLGSAGVRYTEIRGERANKFKLDPVTGVITLKTNEHGFDRETVGQHHLIVEARDNLGLGNRNTTQLLIVLTDVNDQRPKFLLDKYEAFIYENELDFQSPLQVQAQDNDAANTQNSKLVYSIVGGDPQQNFTIDPLTGRIRVRATLSAAPATTASSVSGEPDIVLVGGGGEQETRAPLQSTQTPTAGPMSSGSLQLSGGLDFERIAQKRDETRQFNLTVRVTDNGQPEPLSDTAQVIVFVYDKNDHAPVFTRAVYSKSLREDALAGSAVIQVQAHDGDHSPTNSKITYRISAGASDKFAIDSDSGLISVANGANLDIDRAAPGQRRTSYLLNVLALDGSFGQNQKSSSALVNITILDVNNKSPEFVSLGAAQFSGALARQSHSQQALAAASTAGSGTGNLQLVQAPQSVVFVNEDAPYGLIVTRVSASDLDSSAELRFSINYAKSEARNEDMALVEPSLYRDVFAIERSDGTIKVNKQLDRELFEQVKLWLQVEDLAAQTPDQVAHTYLVVKVADINDNRPTFRRATYKAVVNENSISGTSVITMAADDRDLNKTLRYSLEAASPDLQRLVRINPRSGEVTVNDKIDRELFPIINVTIKAEDFGLPHSLTGSTQLIITVRDENDNNPIFLNSTHLRPNNLSPANSRQAHARSDPNQHRNPLAAGPTTSAPANHNANYHHHRHQLASSPSNVYRLRSLGPPGPVSQSNGGITKFHGEDQPPVLDLTEEHLESRLALGSEGGVPIDESGRELSLLAPGATATVREDAPVGQQIAYVRAEDADVGNNGRVTYLLDTSSNGSGGGAAGKFRIDRDSGILSVGQQLDREQQKHFTLIIEACDNYDLGYSTGESRRAFTQVNIQVTDINDNAPLISTNLNQVHSSSAAAIASSSAASYSASSPLASYPTYAEAMSSPGPYQMALADCLLITEFQPLNEPILTVSATDPDDPETPNGQIDLAIINNLPQNELFSLAPVHRVASVAPAATAAAAALSASNEPVTITSDSRPQFAVRPPLLATSGASGLVNAAFDDHESSSSLLSELHHPTVRVKRSEASSPAKADSADSGPISTARPSASSPNGDLVASATDRPVATSELHRQMHLVVSQSLKERVGNYSVLIRATDRGTPALSSVKLVNICVQDVNNHAPVFSRPALNHTIRIMENATIGSFVAQVEATDLDHGLNGEISYSLKPTNIQYNNIGGNSISNHQANNNDWQSFKIDRLSGVITTSKLFNRQLKKYYTLRVQAQDFGRPTSLSSDIDINIMIVNSGKYQPEFELQQQSVAFTENLAPGAEWFKLLETTNLDDDPALINANQQQRQLGATGASSSLWLSSPCYFIVDGDDYEQVFQLDRFSHRLTNQKELDREKKANYTLIVQASNNCNVRPAMSSRLLAPAMPSSGQQTSVATTTTATTTTTSVMSDATNWGPGARFRRAPTMRPPTSEAQTTTTTTRQPQAPRVGKRIYVDEQAQTGDKFGVQLPATNTNELNLARAFEALVASDKSLMRVNVRVKDVNDNAPKFTQRIYTGGITTEADFGQVFMIVQALDADTDVNGQVSYSIVKPIRRNLSMQTAVPSYQSVAATAPTATSPAGLPTLVTDLTESRQQAQKEQTNLPLQRQRRSAAVAMNPSGGGGFAEQQQAGTASHNELSAINGGGVSQLVEGDDLFIVNSNTGEISLNFDPQKHMKGYFEFQIQARDPDGLMDSARVLIYLLRQDQRVKFVLRLTPQELRQRLNKFRSVMGNITGALVNIDSYKYFENHDGTVDRKKTSLYLHFVQPEDNTIIDVDKVLTLIDNNIEYLDELYKEFHVLSSEAAQLPQSGSGALVDPIDQVRTSLMGVSSFLALILVLVIALCLNQRTRYERQLKAASGGVSSPFGAGPALHLDPDFHSTTNLPNTNLHSQDPNPIWISGHHHYGAVGAASGCLLGDASGDGHLNWTNATTTATTATAPMSQLDCTGQKQLLGTAAVAIGNAKHKQANGSRPALGAMKMAINDRDHDQKLFHSASSGVGMALDDDDEDGHEECSDALSTSGGDRSPNVFDLNSLNEGIGDQHNQQINNRRPQTQHHKYNAATTATPRDSLSSSHGQVSSASSSGANSASTTNERQTLCSPNKDQQQQQQQLQYKSTLSKREPCESRLKLNSKRNCNNLSETLSKSIGNNSTFGGSTAGAYKEVTIYTEQHQRPASNNQQQTKTSHVNKLASQFGASKQSNSVAQGQPRQSIYVCSNTTEQRQASTKAAIASQKQQQRACIMIHASGANVEQGIIRTGQNATTAPSKKFNHLDAKFVPASNNNHHTRDDRTANVASQPQDQNANNFEASLSKLSILNLETTEL